MAGGEIQFREVFGLNAGVSLSLAVFAESYVQHLF